MAPATEWLFHKTTDANGNPHPSDIEQQRLWLVNRARANPTVEGQWLAVVDDPTGTISFNRDNADTPWGKVNLDLLMSEFAALDPKPPGAFDSRLFNAAWEHSLFMIAENYQGHAGQNDRIKAAGFSCNGGGLNVFSFAQNGLHAHAAYNIDWGTNKDGSIDDDGMQNPRGHRQTIMSVENNNTNIGIAVVSQDDVQEPFPTEPAHDDNQLLNSPVGPLVMTGNYCQASTFAPDHYNRFLVGTVWDDLNGNAMYDEGEGLADVTVMPDHGTFYAVTSAGGGYAIPITAAGAYEVTFAGGALPASAFRTVEVGASSVLLDFVNGADPAGDLSGNNNVNLFDAILALQVLTGLEPADFIHKEADVNQDNMIGLAEVIYILQKVGGF